jgi:uncharacterized membrane protein
MEKRKVQASCVFAPTYASASYVSSHAMKMSIGKQRIIMVAVMLLWCFAIVGYRIVAGNQGRGLNGIGLLWNLFLAAVPFFWSIVFRWADRNQRPVWAIVSFALWLLFLPNAPYILTDLIHLRPRPYIPLWFMLAMLLSCAGTGTLLGYLSLLNVQETIARKFSTRAGWSVAVGSLMLCGFGIYLGRFLRWNSWDALTKPIELARTVVRQFIDSGSHPHPLGVTLIYGVGLLIGYLAIRTMSSSSQRV